MAQSTETQIQPDEHVLLQQLANGENSAFWELWLHHKDHLYRICLQYMGNSQADAEDLLSDIMLKAFEKLPLHAHSIRNLKPWLARFTRNHCIDVHRKRQREEMQTCEIDLDTQMAATPENQEQDQTLSANEAPPVEALLTRLSPPHQQVVVDRFIQGKTYAEMAKHLNVPATAIRKRVQRAREILRREGATVPARYATHGER